MIFYLCPGSAIVNSPMRSLARSSIGLVSDMIDWNRVVESRDEVGAEAFDEVVALFLEEVESALDTLSDEMSDADLLDLLHYLKGSALSLGFRKFADLCRMGEGQPNTESVDLSALISTFETSKSEFLTGISERFGS